VPGRKRAPQNDVPDDPVSNVQWVPVEKVEANEYNPNIVAQRELRLLYHSIKQDGYTSPIVTYYDADRDRYVVVDGFHRCLVMRYHKDIREARGGRLPVVVIDKPLNDRMASTIRHNRARGKHNVAGMANIVFSMLDGGWSEEEVCAQLGMEVDELVRLKYVTGFAKLFEDVAYSQAWETRRQIRLRRDYVAGDEKGRVRRGREGHRRK
jgi:ParB-like chromosome segregation protein Spo0J